MTAPTPQVLAIRKLPPDVWDKFHEAAGARRMNAMEYLCALVYLHERLRGVLDDREGHPRGLDDIRQIMTELKLSSRTR